MTRASELSHLRNHLIVRLVEAVETTNAGVICALSSCRNWNQACCAPVALASIEP